MHALGALLASTAERGFGWGGGAVAFENTGGMQFLTISLQIRETGRTSASIVATSLLGGE